MFASPLRVQKAAKLPQNFSFASEFFVLLFLWLLGVLVDVLPIKNYPYGSFFERDPSLSYPYVTSTVPSTMLYALAIVLPGLLLLVLHSISFFQISKAKEKPCKSFLLSLFLVFLAAGQGIGARFAATNVVKNFVGFYRPNFFAMCDYAGYREAINTGNFTAYNAATVAGALGDVSKCQATARLIEDGHLSFFSGHASIAFTGLGFLSLYLRDFLNVPRRAHFTFPAFLAWSPLALAAWIALTRWKDRYHNTYDLSVGSAVGYICAHLAYQHYQSWFESPEDALEGKANGAGGGVVTEVLLVNSPSARRIGGGEV